MQETMILWGVIFLVALYIMYRSVVISSAAHMEGQSNPWTATLNVFGGFTFILSLYFLIIQMFGGEGDMIPESAWPLLTASLTMIGAAFASALCIMVAAQAGGEMLKERPELSIWALLFVALGEGLAIYGLIVAILLVG